MALAGRARVLDNDKIFARRDKGGLPKLGSKVDANHL
jgi:hypothetical protein